MTRARSIAAFLALLIVATLRIVATYSVFNDTVDEAWHVGCGMVWLAGRAYDCNPEHPPLARGMMALGPYLAGARDPGLQDGQPEGRAVLHHGGNFDRMLALARLGILPFFWLAALVVYLWTRRSFGEPAAFFATVCFTMFPSALAHAGLATTDMPATASIGAAFLAMLAWAEKPTATRSLLFGAALALAVLSKFSSLAFLPSAAVMAFAGYLLSQRPGFTTRRGDVAHALVRAVSRLISTRWWRVDSMSGLGVARSGDAARTSTCAITSSTNVCENCGLEAQRVRRAPPGESETVSRRTPFAIVAAIAAVLIWAGYRFHFAGVPAPELWQGIRDVISHNHTGHPGYLLGRYGEQGWWYYFPVAIAFKTPLALLALLGIGVAVCWSRRAELGGAYVTPLAYALGILIFVAAFGHINLGIRHILPAYIAFSVIAGVGAQWLWRANNIARAILAGLLIWFTASSALSHPDYLAYFNVLAGSRPEKILVDSDLDWGQDMKRLAARLKQLDVKELAFDPFNGAYVEDLQAVHQFPPIQPLDPNGPSHGWNAASLTMLKLWRLGYFKSDPTRELWTDRIPPTERVGKGVLLWYVP